LKFGFRWLVLFGGNNVGIAADFSWQQMQIHMLVKRLVGCEFLARLGRLGEPYGFDYVIINFILFFIDNIFLVNCYVFFVEIGALVAQLHGSFLCHQVEIICFGKLMRLFVNLLWIYFCGGS